MKIKAFLLAILFFLFTGVIQAQRPERRVMDTKVENVMRMFGKELTLDKNTTQAVEEIFIDFYKAQDKIRDNIQGPVSSLAQGLVRQDYQSVRKQNENIISERDKRLKKTLTEDQYKTWISEIEPSLRSKR